VKKFIGRHFVPLLFSFIVVISIPLALLLCDSPTNCYVVLVNPTSEQLSALRGASWDEDGFCVQEQHNIGIGGTVEMKLKIKYEDWMSLGDLREKLDKYGLTYYIAETWNGEP
jgi:hypothetical protein